MTTDIREPRTWPSATIVVRGGIGGAEDLRKTLGPDGSWSVRARPGVSFRLLASAVPDNQVRRTALHALLALGATIVPTDNPGGPPYHRELLGLTPEEFDSILGEPEPNPAPKNERKAKR
jgi:hypothetical protein